MGLYSGLKAINYLTSLPQFRAHGSHVVNGMYHFCNLWENCGEIFMLNHNIYMSFFLYFSFTSFKITCAF